MIYFIGLINKSLLKLSKIYKSDFNDSKRVHLNGQLDIYYHSMLHDDKLANLKRIADLSCLMIETGQHHYFPLVYMLVELTLIFPVATVEHCFSTMKLLKTDLRNTISDDFMNDFFIYSVENKALENVRVENVMTCF